MVEVVMLTTAGLTFSARSAKLSGRACATIICEASRARLNASRQMARTATCTGRVAAITVLVISNAPLIHSDYRPFWPRAPASIPQRAMPSQTRRHPVAPM